MLGQEEHELPDFLLLVPALVDALEPLRPDPFDVQQEVGSLLEDFEGSLLVDCDDLGRQFRADTADRPRGQILLDPFRRGRMGRLEFFGLELLPVLSVDHPATAGLDMLPRRHRGRTACDRHQVFSSFDLHAEDGETILRVVERDSFDQARQVFGHRQVPTRRRFIRRPSIRVLNAACLPAS